SERKEMFQVFQKQHPEGVASTTVAEAETTEPKITVTPKYLPNSRQESNHTRREDRRRRSQAHNALLRQSDAKPENNKHNENTEPGNAERWIGRMTLR